MKKNLWIAITAIMVVLAVFGQTSTASAQTDYNIRFRPEKCEVVVRVDPHFATYSSDGDLINEETITVPNRGRKYVYAMPAVTGNVTIVVTTPDGYSESWSGRIECGPEIPDNDDDGQPDQTVYHVGGAGQGPMPSCVLNGVPYNGEQPFGMTGFGTAATVNVVDGSVSIVFGRNPTPGQYWLGNSEFKFEVSVGADGNPVCSRGEAAPRSFVPYGNCEEKMSSTRYNNGTNPDLDVSDIIVTENPGTEMAEMWNLSKPWGRSLEGEFSLSWDSCWTAGERLLEGEDGYTLWWSDFSENVYPIRMGGEIVRGRFPEVGPNGEIVFTNEDGVLSMTDRYGSFMRTLVPGTAPEFNFDGSEIWFTDQGTVQIYDMITRRIRNLFTIPTYWDLMHSDPNAERMFYPEGTNLSAVAQQLEHDILIDATDVAIRPGAFNAYLIDDVDQLQYALDWVGTGTTPVQDAWDENPQDWRLAIWSHPDWRR